MYKNILPYNSYTDHSNRQAHNDLCSNAHTSHLRRSPYYPLARAIRAGVSRVRTALKQSFYKRPARPSMSWWD